MFVYLDLLVTATDFLQIGSKYNSSVLLKSVQIPARCFQKGKDYFRLLTMKYE